ncbi:diacylglycerol kinase family lipid kinase [Mycoplasmatota bacterium]|nr:diacylglycerol kinase family lipid kinase [Mycoplasmatota bacterium]
MKYLFAVNPVSGKNKAKAKMNQLAILLRDNNIDFMTYETQPYQYANDLKSIILENNITHVFAVGGDGTAHEVLNAIVGLDVFFGVIPFGSGNDFARVLRLPKKIDKVFNMIEKNQHVVIDVGQVKGRYFLNYISFGFDVAILKQSVKFKRFLHGGLAYLCAVISTLITYKCEYYKINDEEKRLYLSTIHNGKFYGGGMKINPFSEINDGILDLCTVKKMNRFKLLLLFPSVFSGKHFKFKKLVKFESKRHFLIETNEDSVVCGIDGELYEFDSPIEVKIIPKSVKMIRY